MSRCPMVPPSNAQQKNTICKSVQKNLFCLFPYPMCTPALNLFGGSNSNSQKSKKKNKRANLRHKLQFFRTVALIPSRLSTATAATTTTAAATATKRSQRCGSVWRRHPLHKTHQKGAMAWTDEYF